VVTEADGDSFVNTATATGKDHLDKTVEDSDKTEVEVLKPSTLVVKEGNVEAYHGDTVTYTFTVTNSGNTPLHDITVSDDKCPGTSQTPTSKVNDDGDNVLEKVGQDGVNPEKWVYSCSMKVPDHTAGEANPIVNTVTATGKDDLNKTVTDTDTHSTRILHPAISLTKDADQATQEAGKVVSFTITVRNTGDQSFPWANLALEDAKCDAPAALTSKNGDGTPGSLDPGETWTYKCEVSTKPGETEVVNVAKVTGTDKNGRKVDATDDARTPLTQPQIAVLPATASVKGPSGCVPKSFNVYVKGDGIKQVTYYVDGKKLKRVTKPLKNGRWQVSINPAGKSFGTHKVTAKIQFNANTKAKTRTLRLTFQRCAKKAASPKFTG
jgi:uncharacterized repeat protein (TIGR01451 family)